MNWMKTYLIEMADLELRWMELMEKQNADTFRKRRGSKQEFSQANPADNIESEGVDTAAETEDDRGGRYSNLDSESE